MSVVARQYDVSANQVFRWRRLYGQQPGASSLPSALQLMPVTIAAKPVIAASVQQVHADVETIEIEVSGTYRIRVGASFDARALGRVLDVLSRAGGVGENSR